MLLLAMMLTPLHILALMDNVHARRVTEAASAATWVSRRAGGAERATGSGWSPGALGASWCCGAGSKLHQHAHPTEVRLSSLHGQLVIRARSCQMASLIGFGPRGFRSCFSLNGSASQISRTIGDTGGSESRGLPAPIPKKPTRFKANDPRTSGLGQVGL